MSGWRVFLFLFLAGLHACGEAPQESRVAPDVALAQAEFVGSDACADCHEREYRDWQGSHHQLAMQDASADTILANFDDTSIEYFGATSRMYRDGDRFIMQTDNSNGELEAFEVSHVFGLTPLQQYLTEFPDGRKQVLPFAWDARAAADGGQRWYHLYPDEQILHDDVLHWTGRYFNWNYMCAECHSTDLQVNYDLESNTFATTWSEISIGCEGCHGPGSRHVALPVDDAGNANGLPVNLNDKDGAAWIMDVETGIAARSKPITSHQQPESCGRCHSRRAPIVNEYEYGKPLLDTHHVSLLEENLYHADGRILEEVYVYGSFLQSKMFAAGVTCSDCHNPHSGDLVTGPNPNDVCSQCHLPTKFATVEHAPTNDCVSCHMQDEIYMGVDPRRDHSFRLPDTATDPEHYGASIAAAREGNVDFAAALDPELPAIVRATLVSEIRPPFNTAARTTLQAAIADSDPLLR
ncbi:MAG: cytochrome c3 family protein, partial [Pseudomonadota bacterium]